MMKIPLNFIKNRIIVSAVVTSQKYKTGFRQIPFIIDTGSSKSFFSEGDALKLQIPMNKLLETQPIRIGGTKYNLLETKEFSCYFRTEQDKLYKIDFQNFSVAKTTKKNIKSKTESQNFPSIIVTDFFVKNNLALYFDPNNNESYIQIKE